MQQVRACFEISTAHTPCCKDKTNVCYAHCSQATSTSTRVPFAERQQNSTSTTSQPAAKRAIGELTGRPKPTKSS
jgi:hypothetical protein